MSLMDLWYVERNPEFLPGYREAHHLRLGRVRAVLLVGRSGSVEWTAGREPRRPEAENRANSTDRQAV